jgi:hypothetical protein
MYIEEHAKKKKTNPNIKSHADITCEHQIVKK